MADHVGRRYVLPPSACLLCSQQHARASSRATQMVCMHNNNTRLPRLWGTADAEIKASAENSNLDLSEFVSF